MIITTTIIMIITIVIAIIMIVDIEMMPQAKSGKDSNSGRSQGISNPLNRIRNPTGTTGGNEYKYSGSGTLPSNDNSNSIFDGEEELKRERKDQSPLAGNHAFFIK